MTRTAPAVASKLSFKWDPTLWKEKGLPEGGCFGCINGHLILGEKHHQLIMAALLRKGWTWAQLAAADQAWGWYGVHNQYASVYDNHPFAGSSPEAKQFPWISLEFTSDAGTQSNVGQAQAKQAFQYTYGLPVQVSSTFKSIEDTGKEYGQGLRGENNINNYLPGGNYEQALDKIFSPIPDPPEVTEEWTDEKERMLAFLTKRLEKKGVLTPDEQNQMMMLWIEKNQNATPQQTPAFVPQNAQQPTAKLAANSYKFVWADGIFEVLAGFGKEAHYSLFESIAGKLGHAPQAYVAGDYTPDPFHPQFGTVTVRWHEGQGVPSPDQLKQLMQDYIQRHQPTSAKIG